MKKFIGIYKITNLINNKVYIGSSLNIKRRWMEHKKSLRGGYHFNKHFQFAWNKYSEVNFKFEIIEILEPLKEKLLDREEYWINYYKSYDSEFGYNVLKNARNRMGIKCSDETKHKISVAQKGKKHTEESKLKMSKQRSGENNHMYGKHNSEEAKKKMSESHKKLDIHYGVNNSSSKFTEEDVINIRKLLEKNISVKEICSIYNVSKHTIYRIKNNKTYQNIKTEGNN